MLLAARASSAAASDASLGLDGLAAAAGGAVCVGAGSGLGTAASPGPLALPVGGTKAGPVVSAGTTSLLRTDACKFTRNACSTLKPALSDTRTKRS